MTTPAPQCALRLALGEREACPGSSCQLWHDSACALAPVGSALAASPGLARYLLELRLALASAAAAAEEASLRPMFHRLLNDELAAEAGTP